MSRTQKLWIATGAIAVVVVLGVALAIWLLSAADRAAEAQAAQVGEARQADGAVETQAGETVPFDSAELLFTGSSALGEQPGYFESVSGEAVLADDGTPTALRGIVEMASVVTNADSLTARLKAEPGMFEVEKYPTAQFTSTAIRPASGEAAGKGATHQIEGNFTLRGITKSITFPAKIEVTPERFALESEFSVNRQDFGVNYEGGVAFPEIRDLVLINLSINAPRLPRAADESETPSNRSNEDEPATRPAP